MYNTKTSPYAILKTFADDLKLLPIGPRTEQAYWACLRQLSEHYGKSPELITPEEIRQYCIYLKEEKKVARQTSTHAICAIKLTSCPRASIASGSSVGYTPPAARISTASEPSSTKLPC